ncbi:MAG: FAD-dependent oxidoreductase, partial [Deltaproteobacteria bacterium]|nr:FAD-dependent oxidoreductase [Deltaproteobacteria bacterium]
IDKCPCTTDIRGWITKISQAEKMGLNEDEVLEASWRELVNTNPFPSVMGRVCPHPCEDGCNRQAKDGAVSINAMERWIGDWSLEKKLAFEKLTDEKQPESIGVIGAGPAGLSFAYQMARFGYEVTVYEQFDHAGGMLYYGIPFYRLPADVLQAEVQRILDLGVELKLGCTVGKDITEKELRSKHQIIFLGIGAHKGKLLRIPGEEGPMVFTGTEYLNRVHRGETVDVGKKVGIIGGGDTAIDAARIARRTGADVTIIYRRTRKEMPAIETEIEDALKEGVKLEYLVAPIEVKRDGDKMTTLVAKRMELGEPDDSGRRRPVPIEGSEFDIQIDSLIAAISQEPEFEPLPGMSPKKRWLDVSDTGLVNDVDAGDVFAGGDVIDLDIAATAVGHGNRAAQTVHHKLRGMELPKKWDYPEVKPERLKLDFYDAQEKAEPTHRPVEEWLSKPDEEITQAVTKELFLAEANRCLSCGMCFGCERCWMYCTPACFKKVDQITPGNYYTVNMDVCDGCKKCAEECPCGFLDMI